MAWPTQQSASPSRGNIQDFQYDAAELTDKEIRLVVLRPLLKNFPYVTCDIVTIDPEKLPVSGYNALSYTWANFGFEVVPPFILANGKEFRVGMNLWCALHQLSPRQGTLTIWIDAICINQRNLRERNHQVRKMGKIYSDAVKVIIWLGRFDYASREAIRCIKQIADQSLGDRYKHTNHVAHELRTFLARKYWKRLWIVQEVILAKEIILYAGSDVLSWRDFTFACNQESIPGIQEAVAIQCLESLRQSTAAQLEHARANKSAGRTLMSLLHACQDSDATDKRDMIYGLLGIANDSSFLEVNYAATSPGLWRYLVKMQSTPPPLAFPSFTFSGDTKITVYFAQFLWDVMKLSEDDLEKRDSDTIVVTGAWTDQIRQLGPSGPELLAARRVTRVNNRRELAFRDWRDELVIDAGTSLVHWDLGVLQRFWLPGFHRDADRIFATNIRSSDKARIATKDVQNRLPQGMKTPDSALLREAKLKKKGLSKKIFRSSLIPTDHEGCWDRFSSVLTDSGQIGMTTSEARPGDLVCRFQNTDIALLLRRKIPTTFEHEPIQYTTEFDIVGRIMLLLRTGEQQQTRTGSQKKFIYSVADLATKEATSVDLTLSLTTLKHLSFWFRPC